MLRPLEVGRISESVLCDINEESQHSRHRNCATVKQKQEGIH
jgi:hypothetical protein